MDNIISNENDELNITFEEAMKELEYISNRISSVECGLDESLQLFKRAKLLSKFAKEKLQSSEKQIQILLENGNEENFNAEL